MGCIGMWTEEEIEHISKSEVLECLIRRALSQRLHSAKHRCKDSDIPFDLDVDDLKPWPMVCPVLGVKIDWLYDSRGGSDNSPSIDRLDPNKGYVAGNVEIISNRANRIKNDADLDEVRAVVQWMELKKDAQIERPEYNPYRQLELYEGCGNN